MKHLINNYEKVKVTLFVAGKVFDEIVYSANYDDAKKTFKS